MWCKNCNIETNEKICPVCNLETVEDKPTEIYWCVKSFKKSIPLPQSFNPWVVLAVIMEQAEGRSEIPLNELLTAPCNIGKVYNLDTISMLEILHNIEKKGELKIIRTAGLDIIHLKRQLTFVQCVENYYESIR